VADGGVTARRFGILALALAALSCGGSSNNPEPSSALVTKPDPKAPPFASQEGAWGKFRSKRFQLTLPLPDGRTWKIDDHSKPELTATHAPTSSRVVVLTTQEEDLMNRQRCEQRARNIGWVPKAPLTTVDEEVIVGPDAYDSRVWIALEAGRPGGSVEGHVYLFGAFLRRCLLVHLSTAVPSAKDEEVLATRLALARARILKGISLDPLRTTDDASVPKEKANVNR
jgi:hypothetical protein